MNRNEAKTIIETEELTGYKLFENRPNKPNEVVIEENNSKWSVYVTSERAGKLENTENVYSTENEAHLDFIERLRADKELRNL